MLGSGRAGLKPGAYISLSGYSSKNSRRRKNLYLSAGISDFTTMWQVRATLGDGFC
jgi:hypothetical protein